MQSRKWSFCFCVPLLIALAGCGRSDGIDLQEEARGIPWELLSGKIVYSRWEHPASPADARQHIFLIDVTARVVRLLCDVPVGGEPPIDASAGVVRDLAVRPDGTSVTFSEMSAQGMWELHDLSLSDGAERVLYPDESAHHLYPSWSRDGHLAYLSNGYSGRAMFVDGNAFLLGGLDNSRLAWTASGAVIVSSEDTNSQGNLYLADPATRVFTPLIVNPSEEWDAEIFSAPALSPDGSKLAYVRWGHRITEDVWVADADGTHRMRLSTEGGYQPAWSPDGKTLLFNHGGKNLSLVDVTTGAVVQVTQHRADYVHWGP